MILTRTHANYWAERRGPAALRKHAQKTTIDDVVNEHALRPKVRPQAVSEPHNTMTLLHMKRKRGEEIDFILERGSWGIPGDDGKADEVFGYQRIDRRVAFCRKWAAKILKGRKQHD